MPELLTADLCVIGAGSGGLAAAAGAAAFGVSVVLVEKERMGGSWLNTGTLPATAFLAAAQHARSLDGATPFGVIAGSVAIDFERMRAHIKHVREAAAPNVWKERFTGLGVRVIEGAASFKNRRTLAVGDAEVAARRFVIATGSLPGSASIAGLEALPHFN